VGEKTYSLQEALQAQSALRAAAGLESERFPVSAFVGMISDEIEILRRQGRSDDDIAGLISKQSPIAISSADIAANYAPPEDRNHGTR
jgi:hypothetical protein